MFMFPTLIRQLVDHPSLLHFIISKLCSNNKQTGFSYLLFIKLIIQFYIHLQQCQDCEPVSPLRQNFIPQITGLMYNFFYLQFYRLQLFPKVTQVSTSHPSFSEVVSWIYVVIQYSYVVLSHSAFHSEIPLTS